jgi:hypothetical protein
VPASDTRLKFSPSKSALDFDAVDFCESAVKIREVGVEQIKDAAIIPDDFGEEETRFLEHRILQRSAPARERFRISLMRSEPAELQPLHAEIVHERFGTRVFQHAANLRVEIRGQTIRERVAEQFIVRAGAPQKITQPCGELELVDRMRLVLFG